MTDSHYREVQARSLTGGRGRGKRRVGGRGKGEGVGGKGVGRGMVLEGCWRGGGGCWRGEGGCWRRGRAEGSIKGWWLPCDGCVAMERSPRIEKH